MVSKKIRLSTGAEPRFFYGYIVVAVSFIILAMMCGAYYSFGVFFNPLLAEFGWTRAITSGAFSLSFILLGLFGVAAGKLNNRFGPRVILTVCGVFIGAGYILMSQVSSIWHLYLFYGALISIGMSGGFVPLTSTVARWFTRRRGMMTGITISGLGMGTLVMPPIVNWLISLYGWRTSYIVVGSVSLVLIILAAQFLKRDPGEIGKLPYGENELSGSNDSNTSGFSLRGAIYTRQFWLLGMAFLFFSLGAGAVMIHIVAHAIGLGISAANAAAVLAVIGGLSTAGRIIMGGASDRIGNKLALIICFSLEAIALAWLLLVARELCMLCLFAVIFGFAYGGMVALISPSVEKLFGLSSHGVILGFIMFGIAIGEGSSPAIAGYLYDIVGNYTTAFLLCTIASATGLILVLLLRLTRREGIKQFSRM